MNAVIKPWLVAGLVVALAGNVLLSAVLIVKLSRFDDSKRQADEAEARAATQHTESAKLQVEVETLTKQKDALAPVVADWQQRLSAGAIHFPTGQRLLDWLNETKTDVRPGEVKQG